MTSSPQYRRDVTGTRVPSISQDHRRAVIALIEAAARSGHPAPSNDEIAALIGTESSGTASGYLQRMVTSGLIRIERRNNMRTIEVVASGLKTAWPAPSSYAVAVAAESERRSLAGKRGATARWGVSSGPPVMTASSLLAQAASVRAKREGLPVSRWMSRPIPHSATCVYIAVEGWRYGMADPYCGCPSATGSSYCPAHAKICSGGKPLARPFRP